MANGDIISMGTLWVGGVKQKLPLNPVFDGDCADAWGPVTIEIRDTDPEEGYRIRWVEANVGSRRLLIADRVLAMNATWEELDALGLVAGKAVTIDGQPCLLRVPTGGTSSGDADNEWDRIVVGGECGISSDDGIWHWNGAFSWCQEVSASPAGQRVCRGSTAADRKRFVPKTQRGIGYRPVLEFDGGAPVISGSDEALGELSRPLRREYGVSLPGGGSFSLREEVDGTLLRELAEQVPGGFTLDLSPVWSGLANNAAHTAAVIVTAGEAARREWAFTKTNRPPAPPVLLEPRSGMRSGPEGYAEFTAGADAEGDAQSFALELSAHADFSGESSVFTAGLQKWENGEWADCTGPLILSGGERLRLPYRGLEEGTERYLRIRARDSEGNGEAVFSEAALLRGGTRLAFQTLPRPLTRAPLGVYVSLEREVDAGASVRVWAADNALDEAPVWEEITEEWAAGEVHLFSNRQKTAESWAVSARVEIDANRAAGEISVRAVGVGAV